MWLDVQNDWAHVLDNAIKYSPLGGDIDIQLRMVSSAGQSPMIAAVVPALRLPCLMVSITDSGIGIPDEAYDRIFEKFYRVKDESTRDIPGMGLGLYTSKIIVEAHGGRIVVESAVGKGSHFAVFLPASS
jgi:signal transduction histidine kinase